jgi:hypothetical protein
MFFLQSATAIHLFPLKDADALLVIGTPFLTFLYFLTSHRRDRSMSLFVRENAVLLAKNSIDALFTVFMIFGIMIFVSLSTNCKL